MQKSAKLIVGAGENSSDIRYATALSTPDDFIYFECEGEKAAILSPLEIDRARRTVKPGVAVLPTAEFSDGGVSIAAQLIALAASRRISRFRVPGVFPALLADRLRAAKIEVEPVAGAFFPEREFKDAREVALIEEAMRITESGMQRAFDILRAASIDSRRQIVYENEPLTSERLRAEIEIAMVRLGGFSGSTIVAGGRQGAEPHNGGSGVLMADAPIVMDIFPRVTASGYYGDLTRTVVKGKAPAIVRNAYAAVLDAREKAKAALRAGVIPAAIHHLAAESMEKAGFRTGCQDNRNFGFFHGLGHGVGLDIHEAPRLSPGNRTPLRGGEIVTVEPGLYYPEWGGIRLEDVVHILPDSCRCLTRIETFLEIA